MWRWGDHGMAYDSVRKRIVASLGHQYQVYSGNQTWEMGYGDSAAVQVMRANFTYAALASTPEFKALTATFITGADGYPSPSCATPVPGAALNAWHMGRWLNVASNNSGNRRDGRDEVLDGGRLLHTAALRQRGAGVGLCRGTGRPQRLRALRRLAQGRLRGGGVDYRTGGVTPDTGVHNYHVSTAPASSWRPPGRLRHQGRRPRGHQL